MNEIEAIYKFSGLRRLLQRMGYRVEKGQGYKPLKVEDVSLQDINSGSIEFTDNGIFLVDSSKQKREIFMYKRDYHLGYGKKPRFHIRKCQVIQEFIDRGIFKESYRRANTEEVIVRNIDDNMREVKMKDLPLCKFCFDLCKTQYRQNMKSYDFVEILKQVNVPEEKENIEVDIFGYVKDWEIISQAFREKHKYTCQKCGLQITNPFDHYYMHVHHKNGNKTDNKESNLQCLCIRCHSSINENHKKRFSLGANKIALADFNSKY